MPPEVAQVTGDIALFGVGASALVLVLVQVAKIFGLPTKFAGMAAVIGGLLVVGAYEAIAAWPQVTPWVRLVVLGLVVGLAAIGMYSQTDYHIERKRAARRRRTARETDTAAPAKDVPTGERGES